MNNYKSAQEQYAAIGVDTESAHETLAKTPISPHCWQGDDVGGFEKGAKLDGVGIQATGNYPGKARTIEELRADLNKALLLIPGKHRLNLPTLYAALLLALLAIASLQHARAADVTWSSAGSSTAGGDGNWTGGSTWWNGSSAVTWSAGDNAIFTAAGNTTVNSAVSVGNITFTSSSADISILGGAGDITLNSGGITATNSANTAARTFTISESIALGANQTWTVTNGGATGTANLAVSGIISGTNLGITKAGNGTLTLSGNNTYTGTTTVSAGTLKLSNAGKVGAGALSVASGATFDMGNLNQTVAGLSGAGNITLGQSASTVSDGSALISSAKNYTQLLDFGNAGGATVNGVTFNSVATSGTGWALTGATSGYNQNSGSGYAQLMSDFYYGGRPGTLTFTGLTSGALYEAVLYTQIGWWGGRPQNATFTNNGSTQFTLSNIDPGNFGAVVYFFQAQGTNASITMAPVNSANTFHWFGASLELIASPTLTVGDSGNYDFSGVISGPLGLSKVGAGTQILSGANTYTGNTTITAGTLEVSGSGKLGSGSYAGAISNNGTFSYNSTSAQTLSGVISGTGALIKDNSGTLTLSGNNTYSGTTTISDGTLEIGATGRLGAGNYAQNISNNGTLIYSGTSNQILSGGISGTGALTHNASSTLTLSGANTYNGTTTINAGTLVVSGTNTASAITINSGATLLSNTSLGSTTVNNSGKIGVGTSANSVGSLTVAGLTLNSGGTFTWDMSNATGAAGTGWDRIVSSGLLTIGATSGSKFTIAIASSGVPANWDYTSSGQTWDIITYGSLSGFSADKFAFDDSAFAGSLTSDSAWALSDTGSALRLTYTYTATTPTWSGSSGNWSSGFNPLVTSGADAIFAGSGGTATNNILSGNLSSVGSLIFSGTGAYTLQANSGAAGYNAASALAIGSGITNNSSGAQTINLALSFAANQTISANSGDIIIGGPIAGAGGITKEGANALTLSGSNTYSGDTTLAAGRLNINNATALGTGTLTISGGTLDNTSGSSITLSNNNAQNWNSDFSFAGTNDLNLGTGAVAMNASRTVTISNGNLTVGGVISGSGFGLTKSGSGTLTLNGNNAYTGATTINAGTLEIGAAGRLGAGSYAGNIAINGLTSAFVYSGTNSQTLSGAISGNGALTKNGNATLTLSGASKSITGNVTINGGTVSVSGGALNTNITVNSGATLTGGAHYTIAGGGKTVTLNGGTLNVGGFFIEPGAIVMNNGTVTGTSAGHVLSNNGWTGTGTNTINNRVSLENSKPNSGLFDIQSGTTTINAVVYNYQNRTLGITKNGTGTLLLNGNNTFAGTTTINAGTLEIGGSGRLGGGTFASNITNNAALIYSGTNDQTLSGVISGNGVLTHNASSTLTLTNANTYSGGTTLNAGTLVIGNAAAAGTGTITQSSASSLLKLDTTGTIANAMSIYNVSANKTVTLSGGITVNNAVFDVADGETLTISNTINGTGGVTKNGTGTLVLSGNNTYQSATVINSGTLEAASAGALGSNNTVEVTGGSLLVTADDAISGKNIELSTNTIGLKFSGTYSGAMGTLTLSADSSIDLGTGSVRLLLQGISFSTHTLRFYNWTGLTLSAGGTGNDTDRVYFGPDLSDDAWKKISFYSGSANDSFLGTGFDLGLRATTWDSGLEGYQIIPVPEPETYATGLLLLLGGAWWMWKQKRKAQSGNRGA